MLLRQAQMKPATGAKKTTEIGSLFASSSFSCSFLLPLAFDRFLLLPYRASTERGQEFPEIEHKEMAYRKVIALHVRMPCCKSVSLSSCPSDNLSIDLSAYSPSWRAGQLTAPHPQ